jgi:hypothetical protein
LILKKKECAGMKEKRGAGEMAGSHEKIKKPMPNAEL